MITARLTIAPPSSMRLPHPPRAFRRSHKRRDPQVVRYLWAVELGLITHGEAREMHAVDGLFEVLAARTLHAGGDVDLALPDGTTATARGSG